MCENLSDKKCRIEQTKWPELKAKFFILLFSFGAYSIPVSAQSLFELSGFASLVGSKVLTKNNSNQSDNFDAMGREFTMRDLSLLGLRGDFNLENKLSVTAQAVIYGDDNYKPRFDWIFASYELSENWQVSLGRMRTPLFMYSAYQDVSYATPWLSPPYSVYGIPKLMSFDGIKLRHQTLLGTWSSDMQLWYGVIDERLRTNDLDERLTIRNTVGVTWSLEREWLHLHNVYMQGVTSVDLYQQKAIAPLLNLLRNIDAKFAKKLEWKEVKAHYAGTGIGLDFNTVFINSEATFISLDDNIATAEKFQSYYLTLGIRPISKWTFSATLNRDYDREHKGLSKAYEQLLSVNSSNSNLPSSAEFTAQLEQMQRYSSKGFMLTSRWDFHRSASVKVEYLAEQRRYGKESKRYRPQAIRFGVDLVF